ncbi:hypothetical protein RSO41_13365 [Halomonas sp. I1]|uniref:hypothetical protein n=1 Tax=Halomonas sp. I1 TaxID=393536 RepID=UPI0028DDA595|nr:hypothetical protein [Halomonas sp. I1]MDT8895641.1 hypothetical protein [Halomonas sp. I1]
MSLTDQIENAGSKDELEKIGKKSLGVDIDKRKGLESLRADLLERVEDQGESGEAPVEEHAEGNADGGTVAPESDGSTPASKITEAPASEGKPEQEAPKQRLLRHRGNGRIFAYSAALAAKRHIEEV